MDKFVKSLQVNNPGCAKHGRTDCAICAVVDSESVIKSIENKGRVRDALKRIRKKRRQLRNK